MIVTLLFDWPDAAEFGRVIPKSRIVEHAGAGAAVRKQFTREVDKIIWSHKLAPETVNLRASRSAPEIQIIRIALRVGDLQLNLLQAIDRAIPFPLFFEVTHEKRIRLVAAHKRPSEAGRARWVIGEYFESEWLDECTPRSPLPMALDMGSLYERLLTPLVEIQLAELMASTLPERAQGVRDTPQLAYTAAGETNVAPLVDRMASVGAIRTKVREIKRFNARLGRERQFNRRVEINTKLRTAIQELRQMTMDSPDSTKRN